MLLIHPLNLSVQRDTTLPVTEFPSRHHQTCGFYRVRQGSGIVMHQYFTSKMDSKQGQVALLSMGILAGNEAQAPFQAVLELECRCQWQPLEFGRASFKILQVTPAARTLSTMQCFAHCAVWARCLRWSCNADDNNKNGIVTITWSFIYKQLIKKTPPFLPKELRLAVTWVRITFGFRWQVLI